MMTAEIPMEMIYDTPRWCPKSHRSNSKAAASAYSMMARTRDQFFSLHSPPSRQQVENCNNKTVEDLHCGYLCQTKGTNGNDPNAHRLGHVHFLATVLSNRRAILTR